MRQYPALRILVWVTVLALLASAAGFYRGGFTILRWLVSFSGVLLAFTAYRNRKFVWLSVFVLAAVVFNPIIPIYLNHAGIWRGIDLVTAALFGVFLWSYYDIYGKGYRFETYAASLFPRNIWTITDKTRDFSRLLKRPVESDSHPDFTFRHLQTGQTFAVECKYRSYFYKGGIDWDKQKGENYRMYGKKHGIPVLVIIGVGKSPKNPERLFFCPLETLNNSPYQIVAEQKLLQFERNSAKKFTSIEEIFRAAP